MAEKKEQSRNRRMSGDVGGMILTLDWQAIEENFIIRYLN